MSKRWRKMTLVAEEPEVGGGMGGGKSWINLDHVVSLERRSDEERTRVYLAGAKVVWAVEEPEELLWPPAVPSNG